MTDQWTDKRLNLLHFSITNELKSHHSLTLLTVELVSIKNQIASSYLNSEADLKECRSRLCGVCRGNQMYDCDVDVGWSANCALIGHHMAKNSSACASITPWSAQ